LAIADTAAKDTVAVFLQGGVQLADTIRLSGQLGLSPAITPSTSPVP